MRRDNRQRRQTTTMAMLAMAGLMFTVAIGAASPEVDRARETMTDVQSLVQQREHLVAVIEQQEAAHREAMAAAKRRDTIERLDRRILYASDPSAELARLTYPLGDWRVHWLSQRPIDHDNDGRLDEDGERLRRWIRANLPPDARLLILDWEGPWMETLKDSESPEFDRAVADGVRALQIVKEERPDVLTGFYSLPPRIYWGIDANRDKIEASLDGMRPIMDASDLICPSLYDFYPGGGEGDERYVKTNVRWALEAANGQPVLPWIWHRWHVSSPQRLGLIPIDEYKQHLRWALSVEVDGTRVDGFVVWNRDASAQDAADLPEEAPAGMSLQEHVERVELTYINAMNETLRSVRLISPRLDPPEPVRDVPAKQPGGVRIKGR